MDSVETAQRRRVAICDGATRHDIAAPADMTMDAVLRHVGIDGPVVLRDRTGAEVDPLWLLREYDDGDVFTVVDPSLSSPRSRRRRGGDPAAAPHEHAAAMVAVFAVLIALLAPLTARASGATSIIVGLIVGVAALAVGIVWARRTTADDADLTGGFYAPLALALAAGLLVSPALAWGSVHVAVICAASAVAVLAGVMTLVAAGRVVAAAAGAVTGVAAAVAGLWALVLVWGLPAAAACAVTLGLAPVVLRVLPSSVLSAAPGMFIDFMRFQTLRWSARQREPEPAHAVRAAQARSMVAQSAARWRAGTILVCVTVAVSAPFALARLDTADVLTRSGQIAVAVCLVIALTLQSRRALHGTVRWMPRAATAVVVASLAVGVGGIVGVGVIEAAAVVLLAVAVIAAAVIVPIGRGLRSLRWSRVGDMLESLAIALALPAGLLAAGVVDLLRGMMAA
ncbi:hypothetical protein ET475_03405 [Microbacterium protaetiae]|uniref:EccD-like transmembrane domain-containing protein n=1 Tax=Microbacterium protaetiae TaxID=2509458 RepID=A0A4P6EAH9_9MICO|nr:hypothetical protein [Microbacterium protaetiae]QAY59130.1 hypothetical protein ET475_03405 [Microbacterium protaetiae]